MVDLEQHKVRVNEAIENGVEPFVSMLRLTQQLESLPQQADTADKIRYVGLGVAVGAAFVMMLFWVSGYV